MNKQPKVSIGLPVYNGERYVGQAIESVLNQTFTDLELFISDNASTDRTRQICEQYAARDSRVTYNCLPANTGPFKILTMSTAFAAANILNGLPPTMSLNQPLSRNACACWKPIRPACWRTRRRNSSIRTVIF